jgi:hypothetical protein
MLSKTDDIQYLGWAQPEGNFLTCRKTTITIGQGKIEKTQEKCPPDSGPTFFFGLGPSSFRLVGEVDGINTTTKTLKVKEEFGGTKAFYYLPADLGPKSISLDDIKVGDKITITGPMQGRADAITR